MAVVHYYTEWSFYIDGRLVASSADASFPSIYEPKRARNRESLARLLESFRNARARRAPVPADGDKKRLQRTAFLVAQHESARRYRPVKHLHRLRKLDLMVRRIRAKK